MELFCMLLEASPSGAHLFIIILDCPVYLGKSLVDMLNVSSYELLFAS